MGLDNGIEIVRNGKSMNIYNKVKRFEDEWDKEHKCNFEVAYWRKCWNIRQLVLSCLDGASMNDVTMVGREHVEKIIAVLKSLNKNNWDEYGGSIWEWDEYKDQIKRSIKNLKYLYRLMGKYELDVYFYESY